MKALIRLFPLLKPYTSQIVWAFVSLVLIVVVDLMIPRQIQRIIDDGIAVSDNGVVIAAALTMIGLSLLSMVMTFLNTLFSTRISESLAADVRDKAYRQTQAYSYSNLDQLSTGELLVRLTTDVNQIKNAVSVVLRMVFRAPLMFVGALIILIITSPTLSLTLAVLLPLIIFAIVWYSGKTAPMFKGVQTRLDRINNILSENISGVRVVKAFVREQWEISRFGKANAAYTEANIEVNALVALLFPTLLGLINLGTAAIIYFGGFISINSPGVLTTGELVAFINYLMITVFPIIMLGMVLPQIYAANASAERIFEITETAVTILDKPNAIELQRETVRGRVVFENVAFDYDGEVEQDAVLVGIDFVAEPGETVAILGATGSGKTSLISLIPRLYDVVEGRVTIDGHDVRDISQDSLRRNIGFALQTAVLFSGTVADNIRFGRPNATDDEVVMAATAAQANEFIMAKPDGYEAHVEQRGRNFSGGQKQRLAIARALAVQPKILILDDSTSAVDIETESKIQDALADLMADTTIIVVAQRISTVLAADKIIVLDHGKIAAMGNHRQLIESSPIYQEIYESQLGEASKATSTG